MELSRNVVHPFLLRNGRRHLKNPVQAILVTLEQRGWVYRVPHGGTDFWSLTAAGKGRIDEARARVATDD